MATSRMGITCKPFSISEKMRIINRSGRVPNVPCTKITKELGTPVRMITDNLLSQNR
jgi:hypothetical protein